jgi:glucosamine--fructose-6-phosphate aminotransferase (isomerizing)
MTSEAAEAPEVVRRAFAANADLLRTLGASLRATPPSVVLTVGRGSSDHATLYSKYLIEQYLRIPVSSVAPSVVSVTGATPRDLRTALVIAVSQSGRSPDILASVTAAHDAGARVIAIVNDTASPLAHAASAVLSLEAGIERSVAATKTCIASLAVLVDLVQHWSGDQSLRAALDGLSTTLARASACDWSPLREQFADAQNLFVVSRGPGFGVAHEIALKFKETSAIHAEAFSAAELAHGPMTMVRDGLPVLMLASPDHAEEIAALALRVAARGARVLCAGLVAPRDGVTALPVPANVHAALAPIAWLPSFYPVVAQLALNRGLDPDRPPFLNKVTKTL